MCDLLLQSGKWGQLRLKGSDEGDADSSKAETAPKLSDTSGNPSGKQKSVLKHA